MLWHPLDALMVRDGSPGEIRYGWLEISSGLHSAAPAVSFVPVGSSETAEWFETYVLPHEGAAVRVLCGFRYSPEEVEDLLQQSYVRLLEARRRDTPIQNPRGFLLTIAQHVAIDYQRSRRVTPCYPVSNLEALEVSSPEPGPERVAIGRNLLRAVSQAISGLPPRCRDILLLRKIEGLSQKEVAHRLGIAEDTVQKQVAKAVRLCAVALFRDDPKGALNGEARTAHSIKSSSECDA
jgi:RNA polymerase sigma-70 factor (ECF subfamily)